MDEYLISSSACINVNKSNICLNATFISENSVTLVNASLIFPCLTLQSSSLSLCTDQGSSFQVQNLLVSGNNSISELSARGSPILLQGQLGNIHDLYFFADVIFCGAFITNTASIHLSRNVQLSGNFQNDGQLTFINDPFTCQFACLTIANGTNVNGRGNLTFYCSSAYIYVCSNSTTIQNQFFCEASCVNIYSSIQDTLQFKKRGENGGRGIRGEKKGEWKRVPSHARTTPSLLSNNPSLTFSSNVTVNGCSSLSFLFTNTLFKSSLWVDDSYLSVLGANIDFSLSPSVKFTSCSQLNFFLSIDTTNNNNAPVGPLAKVDRVSFQGSSFISLSNDYQFGCLLSQAATNSSFFFNASFPLLVVSNNTPNLSPLVETAGVSGASASLFLLNNCYFVSVETCPLNLVGNGSCSCSGAAAPFGVSKCVNGMWVSVHY